ncbi:hypothetical protein [Arsenophonus sp.]|uniref:hypothetical protein n=1 Tax=Arsenophonus sp. TaxID=1872640 RepID=UPI00387994C2
MENQASSMTTSIEVKNGKLLLFNCSVLGKNFGDILGKRKTAHKLNGNHSAPVINQVKQTITYG